LSTTSDQTTQAQPGIASDPRPGGASEGLSCRGIRVSFDGIHALDGVDLDLRRGEVLGLIGTNGAGKTTLVNVISGYQAGTGGTVSVDGSDVTGWKPARLARAGVVRTFQAGRMFPALTVLETLEVAGVGGGMSRRAAREQARRLLRGTNLAGLGGVQTASLPHGQVRVLGILRALATGPNYVLVDEPAAGSNEEESDEILRQLQRIVSELEVGLLVIEHDMSLIMRLCPRIQVLDHGKTIAVGSPTEVREDPEVVRAYLGTDGGH
jgi:ABC-type branched-subunit amino acid transport system ATPase component